MKRGTENTIKFKQLQRKLKLPMWQTCGLLEAIWLATYNNAPDGDLGRLSNEDIAALVEWDGDADELVKTLVECGWLDEDPEYRLIVHDWSEHCANYHRGNYSGRNRLFADQVAKQRAKDTARQHAKEPAKQAAKDGANSTPLPSQSKSSQSNPSLSNSRVDRSKDDVDVGVDHVIDEGRYDTVRHICVKIADACPPKSSQDRAMFVKVAWIATHSLNENWLMDSLEAVKNAKRIRKTRIGYLYECLTNKALEMKRNFEQEMARLELAPEVTERISRGPPATATR